MLAKHQRQDLRFPCGTRGRQERTHCAGAKPPCRHTSLQHALRIMFTVSLPVVCVSWVTFIIIFLCKSPRRSPLPICSGASRRAGRTATHLWERLWPKMPLLCVPRPYRTGFLRPTGPAMYCERTLYGQTNKQSCCPWIRLYWVVTVRLQHERWNVWMIWIKVQRSVEDRVQTTTSANET